MKNVLLILVILVSALVYKAQSCTFNNHSIFVLDILDSSTQQKIHDVQIALCDRYGKTYHEYYNDGEGDKNTNIPKVDSFFFWENNALTKNIFNKHVVAFNRQKFDGIGDNYICIVPTFSGYYDKTFSCRNWLRTNPWQVAQRELFLYIKISGKDIPTQTVKIPSGTFYNICYNKLQSKEPTCQIEPIKVIVNNGKASVHDNRFGVIQYQLSESIAGSKAVLATIELIDEFTEATLQKFPSYEDVQFGDKICKQDYFFWQHKGLKLFDMGRSTNSYLPNSKNSLPRIMVPAQFVKDTFKNSIENYESYIVYSFDSVTQRYSLDSLLSAPDYLNSYNNFGASKDNPKGAHLLCLNVRKEKNALIYEHAKLVDEQWKVFRRENKKDF